MTRPSRLTGIVENIIIINQVSLSGSDLEKVVISMGSLGGGGGKKGDHGSQDPNFFHLWSGLPVLTTLYKLILVHKRTNSHNCEFCVYKKCVFNFFLKHFLNFWLISSKKLIYWSVAKLISLYMVDLSTFTLTFRQRKLKASIKVSHILGKHLEICLFKILLFFLQVPSFI